MNMLDCYLFTHFPERQMKTTVRLSAHQIPVKVNGRYAMHAEFSNGISQIYWGLPSKIAKELEAGGYKMTKVDYFTYEGSK